MLDCQNSVDLVDIRPVLDVGSMQVAKQLAEAESQLGFLIVVGEALDLANVEGAPGHPRDVELRIVVVRRERSQPVRDNVGIQCILNVHVRGRTAVDEIGVPMVDDRPFLMRPARPHGRDVRNPAMSARLVMSTPSSEDARVGSRA